MAETCSRTLQDEIAVLKSIYMDELTISGSENRPDAIVIMLHPYTADEEEKKFVCLQLIIKLSNKYPEVEPSFEIKNPRGISDAQLESILVNLGALASQRTGEAMLFELIEYTKECLTDNNRPECACAICLDYFEDDRYFFKTECYHYFHLTCMAHYVKHYMEDVGNQSSDREDIVKEIDAIPCPICRVEIKRDQIKLDDVIWESQSTGEAAFELSGEFLKWRMEMKELFQKQQKQGGIIDIEAEKNKYLIQTKVKDEVPEMRADVNCYKSESFESLNKKNDLAASESNPSRSSFTNQRLKRYSKPRELSFDKKEFTRNYAEDRFKNTGGNDRRSTATTMHYKQREIFDDRKQPSKQRYRNPNSHNTARYRRTVHNDGDRQVRGRHKTTPQHTILDQDVIDKRTKTGAASQIEQQQHVKLDGGEHAKFPVAVGSNDHDSQQNKLSEDGKSHTIDRDSTKENKARTAKLSSKTKSPLENVRENKTNLSKVSDLQNPYTDLSNKSTVKKTHTSVPPGFKPLT